MRESDIVFEDDQYWVYRTKTSYDVMKNKGTHSELDSAYALDEDGLSIAVARCKYLAGRDRC